MSLMDIFILEIVLIALPFIIVFFLWSTKVWIFSYNYESDKEVKEMMRESAIRKAKIEKKKLEEQKVISKIKSNVKPFKIKRGR